MEPLEILSSHNLKRTSCREGIIKVIMSTEEALSENEIGLFRMYRGRPATQQARDDFIGVLNGEIGSVSSIEFDKDGGSTMNLAVD